MKTTENVDLMELIKKNCTSVDLMELRSHEDLWYDCVFHRAGCANGMGAATAFYCVYSKVVNIPVEYHKEYDFDWEWLKNKSIAVVDFSFSEEIMEKLLDVSDHLLWVCHIDTALRKLNPWLQKHINNSKLVTLLSHEHSAAYLCWKYLYVQVPMLARLIEDRNLWKFSMDASERVHYALSSYPDYLPIWYKLFNTPIYELESKGAAIQMWFEKRLDELEQAATPIKLGGYNGFAVNCPNIFASSMGHRLAKKNQSSFGLTYHMNEDLIVYNLRSNSDDCDVAKIAEKFGGGGLARAAGFKLKAPLTAISVLEKLNENWLAT